MYSQALANIVDSRLHATENGVRSFYKSAGNQIDLFKVKDKYG